MTTGGATTWALCATPSIAFGSPPVVRRRFAVQTCRRVESLVLAVTLALGPCFTEPVGGKQ